MNPRACSESSGRPLLRAASVMCPLLLQPSLGIPSGTLSHKLPRVVCSRVYQWIPPAPSLLPLAQTLQVLWTRCLSQYWKHRFPGWTENSWVFKIILKGLFSLKILLLLRYHAHNLFCDATFKEKRVFFFFNCAFPSDVFVLCFLSLCKELLTFFF